MGIYFVLDSDKVITNVASDEFLTPESNWVLVEDEDIIKRVTDQRQFGLFIYSRKKLQTNFVMEQDKALDLLRSKRDKKLQDNVDPIVLNSLRWNSLSQENKTAVENYRQALLDLPTNFPNVTYTWNEQSKQYDESNVTWPELVLT